MKKLFLLLLVGTISTSLFAQKDHNQISAGLEVGLPTGLMTNALGVGIGATGKGLYGVGTNGQLSATLGYIRYGFSESGEGMSAGMSVIPIMPGYRHYFNNVYAEGQLGLAVISSNYNVGGWSGSVSSTNASMAIGGGYLFEDFDVSLRYQGYGIGFGSLGIRVAYNFEFSL